MEVRLLTRGEGHEQKTKNAADEVRRPRFFFFCVPRFGSAAKRFDRG